MSVRACLEKNPKKRTFLKMSVLAIAAETFETTCKNTVVTDMLTFVFLGQKNRD
jgi:hypothetical protein